MIERRVAGAWSPHVSEITPLLSLYRRTSEGLLCLITASIRNNCHVHRDPFAHKHLYIGSSTKPIDCQNIGDRVTSSLYPLENKLLILQYPLHFCFCFLDEFLLNLNLLNYFNLVMLLMMWPLSRELDCRRSFPFCDQKSIQISLKFQCLVGDLLGLFIAIISSRVRFEATNLGKVAAPPVFLFVCFF